ncbi:MAG: type 4a pilus biogenesis protein PilO [Solirubrobacteraceae bacterium]|jgi:Tfp pilus assembly protein PilO
MTTRDRTVLIAVVLIAVLGAAWMLVVSPERKQANELNAQVTAAQAQLTSAEGQVANARAAQSQYAAAYSSVVSLGKAVPPTEEVPALIDQLAQATNRKNVEFASITSGSSGSSAAAASAAFTALPFTFTFEGSYFDLEHLFNQLTSFATSTPSGDLQISGRLLTIQSVKLAPGASSASSGKPSSKLTGSITATAYTLPASQGLTGTASATSPTGATTPASTSAATSSSPPAAIVKVTP